MSKRCERLVAMVLTFGLACGFYADALAGAIEPARAVFSADIRVTRQMVGGVNAPVGTQASSVVYHVERRRANAGWRTVTTIDQDEPSIANRKGEFVKWHNPMALVRIEDDEDGTPLRFYNRQGQQVTIPEAVRKQMAGDAALTGTIQRPAASVRPVSRDDEWLQSLIVRLSDRDKRRRSAEVRLGRSVGRVRGMLRFVGSDAADGGTQELLLEPTWGVPVEMNHVRAGKLVSRRTLEYDVAGPGQLVRRRMRSEHVLDEDSGRRVIVDVEWSNVRNGGGAQ